jgi:hypothetical protein
MAHAGKLILVAHHDAGIRGRFVAALADAHHDALSAGSAREAIDAARRGPEVSLAVVDAGLADDPVAFVAALRTASHAALPVLVFSSTVPDADAARRLLGASVAGYVNDHAAPGQMLPALAPHLFPASFDRRVSPRLPLGLPVSYRSGTTIAAATTLNVSRGGLAIRTLTPLEPGAELSVKFRLPSAVGEVERTGRVIWADARVGMGIQVDDEIEV